MYSSSMGSPTLLYPHRETHTQLLGYRSQQGGGKQMGTALCCRESPSHWEPAQVCYKALTSAKPTGKKATGHMTALPRPGLTVP